MEKFLIPMIALDDIQESIPAMGIGCKKGDVFMLDLDNEIHLELMDNNLFKDYPNDQCVFICKYVGGLALGDKIYQYNDEIDISNLTDDILRNLYSINYIKKEIKKKINNSQKSVKNNKIKKAKQVTYTQLAKQLNKNSKDFKKEVLELTGIQIKDMRTNIPNKEKKIIIEAFKK